MILLFSSSDFHYTQLLLLVEYQGGDAPSATIIWLAPSPSPRKRQLFFTIILSPESRNIRLNNRWSVGRSVGF